MAQASQLQVWMLGLFATTGDAVMLGLYGPNAGGTNLARFRNAEFDELYRQSKHAPSAEERRRVYESMAQIIGTWNPWGTARLCDSQRARAAVDARFSTQSALPASLALRRHRPRAAERRQIASSLASSASTGKLNQQFY